MLATGAELHYFDRPHGWLHLEKPDACTWSWMASTSSISVNLCVTSVTPAKYFGAYNKNHTWPAYSHIPQSSPLSQIRPDVRSLGRRAAQMPFSHYLYIFAISFLIDHHADYLLDLTCISWWHLYSPPRHGWNIYAAVALTCRCGGVMDCCHLPFNHLYGGDLKMQWRHWGGKKKH